MYFLIKLTRSNVFFSKYFEKLDYKYKKSKNADIDEEVLSPN